MTDRSLASQLLAEAKQQGCEPIRDGGCLYWWPQLPASLASRVAHAEQDIINLLQEADDV